MKQCHWPPIVDPVPAATSAPDDYAEGVVLSPDGRLIAAVDNDEYGGRRKYGKCRHLPARMPPSAPQWVL